MQPLDESHYQDLLGAPWALGGSDPSSGIDCWQLVRLVCERRGILVPDLSNVTDYKTAQAVAENDLGGWHRVKPGKEQPGDVAAYSLAGSVIDHVGLLLPDGNILHARDKSGVVALPQKWSRAKFQGWHRPGPPPATAHVVSIRGHDPVAAQQVVGDRQSGVVVLRVYRSVLNLRDFETHVCEWTGKALDDYLPSYLDRQAVMVTVNGGRISRDGLYRYTPKQGDLIEALAQPGVTAALIGSTLAIESAFLSGVLAFAVNTLISVGLSFLGKLLAAPAQLNQDQGPVDQSPTFSQTGIRNTIAAGGTIPIVIGTHRVGGQIIGTFNTVGGLTVTPYSGSGTPTNPAGPFDIIQNTNQASATGGKTTLNLLIAVSEGEVAAINGLTADTNDLAGSQLAAGTLLINGNDASDYNGVSVSCRMGTTDQPIIPGFDDTTNAVGVERILRRLQPWTYTTSQDVQAFAIQLYEPNGHFRIAASDGSTRQKTVQYDFKYRPAGSATWSYTNTITRGYINRAAHSWEIRIDNLPLGKYEVYLERLTHDDDDSLWQSGGSNNPNEVSLSQVNAINEITYASVAHSGVALLAVKAVATDQLSGVPTVTSLVQGKKWWVWDGVSSTNPDFTFKWTDNPGEIIQGLLTNQTIGLGKYVGVDSIDWDSAQDVVDYCDETIDDGRGGTFARCKCNMVYDVAEKGGDLLDKILNTCRSAIVPMAGKLGFKVDQARSPTHLFSEGNVTDVKIGYTEPSDRPSKISVQFANEELDYDIDTVSVEDQTVDADEWKTETITAIGITHPARAMRLAQYRLNVSQTLLKTLEFKAPVDAVTVQPGDVFWFSHGELSTNHIGGRIVATQGAGTKLDRPVTVAAGTYKLRVMGILSNSQTRAITEKSYTFGAPATYAAGAYLPITWTVPTAFDAGAVYAFGPTADYLESFQVIDCPLDSDLNRTVQAIQYDATVYDDDPGTVPAATDVLHDQKLLPPAVSGLKLREEVRTTKSGDIRSIIAVSWVATYAFESADVYVRAPYDDDFRSWERVGRFENNYAEIDQFGAGSIVQVAVVPVSPLGHAASPESGAVKTIVIHGKLDRPAAVADLDAFDVADGVMLTWTKNSEPDIHHYEVRYGDNWPLAQHICTTQTDCIRLLPVVHNAAAKGSYLVKAVNTSGRESESAASVALASDLQATENVTQTEDGTWSGTRTNMTVSGSDIVSSSATSGGYQTAAIDTGAIAWQFITVGLVADLNDRSDPVVEDADWLVAGAASRVRTVTAGVLSDYPDDIYDHVRQRVSGASYLVDSATASSRTVFGPTPATQFKTTVEMKVADTSGALAAASWEAHSPKCRDFRWYQVRVSWVVPHVDYQVTISGLTTGAYKPAGVT